MKIIISPAKKMNIDTDTFPTMQPPHFKKEAEYLMNYMKRLTYSEAREVWGCSEKLARQNYDWLQRMDLEYQLTPALISYEGIQYQYMAPKVMEQTALKYLEEHLRILSGFYGILRPFDGVVPYRLEMQAKLAGDTPFDLYQYWGAKIYDFLAGESSWILNLASREYSRCVLPFCADRQVITCVFGELKDGKVKEKGTLAKMARGEMVRFLAVNKISTPEGMKEFCGLGYRFNPERSDEGRFVFLKENNNH